MSNPTLASITAELEAVETAARGRGSLTCDHLAGRIANIRGELQQIAQPHPPAEAQPDECAPIRYFAYDRDCGDYNEFDTLPEAIADAQEALDCAGDDGWPQGGPSIYYGAVLGEAREVEGSRRPPGPDDHPDADFIVEYELAGSCALAQQQPAAGTHVGFVEWFNSCGVQDRPPSQLARAAWDAALSSQQPAAVDSDDDAEPSEPCESALPDCGPAVAWDDEGIGACERCARELGCVAAQQGGVE